MSRNSSTTNCVLLTVWANGFGKGALPMLMLLVKNTTTSSFPLSTKRFDSQVMW
jgi:hypothetical protein